MKLTAKFNLVLVGVLLVGLLLVALLSYRILQANAREEVIAQARIMLDAALSIRGYTVNQIRPLLAGELEHQFLPQTVPAYAATETLSSLRKDRKEYSYKEATLNPTNLRDRAVDWEADLVEDFRNNSEHEELIGEREAPTGRMLYLARPIRITAEGCLVCHSVPNNAPASMIERYGVNNGFGWQLNEVVGAQIVTVPMSLPIENAQHAFATFIGAMLGVFVLILIALNVFLRWLVIKPITSMSKLADRVSMGEMGVPDCEVKTQDEIGVLAKSFNRMHRSLSKAMSMLS